MTFSKYVLSGFMFTAMFLSAQESKAGFDVTFGENAVTVKQNAPATPTDKQNNYAVNKGIDPSAPALKIYQESYVPDSIRKKYEQPAKQQTASDELVLTNVPSEMPAPESVQISPLTPEPNVAELFPAPVVSAPTDITVSSDQLVIVPKPNPVNTVDSWRARQGENVRDVLRRWTKRQNVELMWASASVPALQKDYSYFGNFQDAVSGLLQQAGMNDLHSQYRSEGMDPVLMAPASTITTNTAVPVDAVEKTNISNPLGTIFTPDTKVSGPETRWFGLSGAPLAEVLQVWAEDAGISLVWQAESNYALKESISQTGHFEDAVYSALSQYDEDMVRPVGEMYNDAASGQKVLVIRTDAAAL